MSLAPLAGAVHRMLHLPGLEHWDAWSRALVGGWRLAPWIVLAGLAWRRRAADWRMPLFWLLAAVLACSPALSVQRDGLLLFPVSFVALAYATGLFALRGAGSRAWTLVAGAVLAWGLVAGAQLSRVFATHFHPYSIKVIGWNSDFLYGRFEKRATIPPERRQAAARRLATVGIRHGHNLNIRLRALLNDALAENRTRPGPDEVVFHAPLPIVF
jgi:hypothetical protein